MFASVAASSSSEAQEIRALQTLMEMAALLGEPSMINPAPETQRDNQQPPVQADPDESVATWSKKIHPRSVHMIATTDSVDPPAMPLPEDDEKAGRVRFQASVSVVSIPSHRDMTASAKERLWTDRQTIHKRGMQNTLEWKADGKDWRRAKEEHQMVWDHEAKDYVHPFTVNQRRAALERRQDALRREQEHQRRWVQHLEREYAQHHSYEYCL